MIELKYGKRKFLRPASWEECERNDFERLAVCALAGVKAKTQTEMWDYAVPAWLNVLDEWHKWRLTAAEWVLLKRQVEWVFEATTLRSSPTLIVRQAQEWLLPSAGFGDCKSIELAMGFVHYLGYAKPTDTGDSNENEEAERGVCLDKLIATFCRPRRRDLAEFRVSFDWDGDEREVYNEARLMERLPLLADVEIGKKMAFLAFFEANLTEFMKDYADIFGASGGKKAMYNNGMGMIMMLKDVAKQGHFGDFERVCMQPVHLLWTAVMDDILKNTTDGN